MTHLQTAGWGTGNWSTGGETETLLCCFCLSPVHALPFCRVHGSPAPDHGAEGEDLELGVCSSCWFACFPQENMSLMRAGTQVWALHLQHGGPQWAVHSRCSVNLNKQEAGEHVLTSPFGPLWPQCRFPRSTLETCFLLNTPAFRILERSWLGVQKKKWVYIVIRAVLK